ncbi:cupin domain-containing protein [Sphingopyxis sp.]|uniref:cupin domain-containing protein n=1 Tax=Sphingopyxis sp. TaxID=1908224 RepID=UPI003D6CD490
MSEQNEATATLPGRTGPTKIEPGEASDAVFGRPGVVKDGPSIFATALSSTDRYFSAGVYKCDAVDIPFDAYPYDEFLYMLSGTLTLVSDDGTSLAIDIGDAGFIPKGWKGRWVTAGLVKHYAVYTNGGAE